MSPIPLPYRIAAMLTAISVAALLGWIDGAAHEAKKAAVFADKVETAGLLQAEEAKRKDLEHAQNARAIAQSVTADRIRLDAALERLRHADPGGSTMPEAPARPEVAGGWAIQRPPACEDSDADPCAITRDEFERALKDALLVQGWLEWVRVNGMPVAD